MMHPKFCKTWNRMVKGLILSQTTNLRLFQTERFCRRQFQNLTKMTQSASNQYKTLWEKEKLLVMSNFSFSHSVFKRTCTAEDTQNQGLFGKGLRHKYIVSMTYKAQREGIQCFCSDASSGTEYSKFSK